MGEKKIKKTRTKTTLILQENHLETSFVTVRITVHLQGKPRQKDHVYAETSYVTSGLTCQKELDLVSEKTNEHSSLISPQS